MSRRRLLVLGGTGFLGRHFVETSLALDQFHITIASRNPTSRGYSGVKHITIDRDDFAICKDALEQTHWDNVVDFSGTNYARVLHTVATIETDHYSYVSSSAVDLATPNDPLLEMAKEKLWCEHIVANAFDHLIVRAGFVVGNYDHTGRFEKRGLRWYWKGTDRLVRPVIEAKLLAHTIHCASLRRTNGIVRAGYSEG